MSKSKCEHGNGICDICKENLKNLPGGFALSGIIVIQVGNLTFEGIIDGEDFFTADLRQAIRNGKDPIHAITFLTNEGSKKITRRSSISWKSAIGD